MSNMVVLHNPSAGKSPAVIESLARLAGRHGCGLRSLGNLAGMHNVVQSVASEVSRIIVAGGDGTVSQVANALLPKFTDVELAVIPLGTGNDLARSLDLPLDNREAAFELAATRPATAIDVVLVHQGTGAYYVNAATAGFGGEVTGSLTAMDKQTWGIFAYWLAAVSKLADLHAYSLELSLDGERSRHQVYGIAMANGRYVGGGFPIAGGALLNDGLIDVVIIPEAPTLELLSLGLSFALGRLPDGGPIQTKQARRIEFSARPAMPISLDGEATRTFDASMEIIPGALRMVRGDHPEGLGGSEPSGAGDFTGERRAQTP